MNWFLSETQTESLIETEELKSKETETITLQVELEKQKLINEQLVIKRKRILEKKASNDFHNIKLNSEDLNFMTGLKDEKVFNWFLSLFVNDVSKIKQSFSYENHLLLVLMKLRLGLSNRDLAHRFNLNRSNVSKIYRNWLPAMASKVKFLIIWPSRSALRKKPPIVL